MLLNFFKKIIKFFGARYPLFLLLLVVVSYGQILFMTPWQEDNVVFFKVAHIDEQAGYMGKGILGEGPYRHTITPYYFLYKTFGYNIPVFYALMLASYFFATVSIYFLVRKILGKKAGMIASFVFGAGYVASEGFFRVYTSTNISSGIAFTALTFLAFWNYYKKREFKWYLFTLFMYWATIQVSYVRVHYLIIPLLAFDFLFLVLPKISQIKWLIIRSIPFALVFYEYYIVQGDSRKSGIIEVAKAILSGKFEYTHSFLGSLGNLFVPDFIQSYPVAVGIAVLIIATLLIRVFQGEKKKIFILSMIIIFANIAAYAAYTPEVVYATNYRYLAHSFFGFAVILGLLSSFKPAFLAIPGLILGVVFLFIGINTQRVILKERTAKINYFYSSLKEQLPVIPKDSPIYFDIQDSDYAKETYKVSFSVAEMPETTAIAWRYGIDRYDFKMFTESSEFLNEIKANKIPLDKIFSFWLSDNGLLNTSDKTREFLTIKRVEEATCLDKTTASPEIICKDRIESQAPTQISITLSASPSLKNHVNSQTENPIYKNFDLTDKALNYGREKQAFLRSLVAASSSWKDREIENIKDGDVGTIWQSDRIAWEKEETFVSVDLGSIKNVSRCVFVPAHKNNIPVKFVLEVSLDGKNWQEIKDIRKSTEAGLYEISSFEPVDARFVKMKIFETSGGDSPQIAEIWTVSDSFRDMKISDLEEFLASPFAFVADESSFKKLLSKIGNSGKIKVFWKGDKSPKWISRFESTIEVPYDSKPRTYSLVVPPGGTYIDSLKLEGLIIPGEVTLYNVVSTPAKGETL